MKSLVYQTDKPVDPTLSDDVIIPIDLDCDDEWRTPTPIGTRNSNYPPKRKHGILNGVPIKSRKPRSKTKNDMLADKIEPLKDPPLYNYIIPTVLGDTQHNAKKHTRRRNHGKRSSFHSNTTIPRDPFHGISPPDDPARLLKPQIEEESQAEKPLSRTTTTEVVKKRNSETRSNQHCPPVQNPPKNPLPVLRDQETIRKLDRNLIVASNDVSDESTTSDLFQSQAVFTDSSMLPNGKAEMVAMHTLRHSSSATQHQMPSNRTRVACDDHETPSCTVSAGISMVMPRRQNNRIRKRKRKPTGDSRATATKSVVAETAGCVHAGVHDCSPTDIACQPESDMKSESPPDPDLRQVPISDEEEPSAEKGRLEADGHVTKRPSLSAITTSRLDIIEPDATLQKLVDRCGNLMKNVSYSITSDCVRYLDEDQKSDLECMVCGLIGLNSVALACGPLVRGRPNSDAHSRAHVFCVQCLNEWTDGKKKQRPDDYADNETHCGFCHTKTTVSDKLSFLVDLEVTCPYCDGDWVNSFGLIVEHWATDCIPTRRDECPFKKYGCFEGDSIHPGLLEEHVILFKEIHDAIMTNYSSKSSSDLLMMQMEGSDGYTSVSYSDSLETEPFREPHYSDDIEAADNVACNIPVEDFVTPKVTGSTIGSEVSSATKKYVPAYQETIDVSSSSFPLMSNVAFAENSDVVLEKSGGATATDVEQVYGYSPITVELHCEKERRIKCFGHSVLKIIQIVIPGEWLARLTSVEMKRDTSGFGSDNTIRYPYVISDFKDDRRGKYILSDCDTLMTQKIGEISRKYIINPRLKNEKTGRKFTVSSMIMEMTMDHKNHVYGLKILPILPATFDRSGITNITLNDSMIIKVTSETFCEFHLNPHAVHWT